MNISSEDFHKYQGFVEKCLDKGDALAGILFRLQKTGLEPEIAREIVKTVATSHARVAKIKAIGSLIGGAAGAIFFLLTGLSVEEKAEHFGYAAGTSMVGALMFYSANKRLKYLKSLK